MFDTASEKSIVRFFEDFVEAFATFDGTIVGRLFATPGVASAFVSRSEVCRVV